MTDYPAPICGMGEEWEDQLLAITKDSRKALQALEMAAGDNYGYDELNVAENMKLKSAVFAYDQELFGGDGGWYFYPNPPKSAPVITYWCIESGEL